MLNRQIMVIFSFCIMSTMFLTPNLYANEKSGKCVVSSELLSKTIGMKCSGKSDYVVKSDLKIIVKNEYPSTSMEIVDTLVEYANALYYENPSFVCNMSSQDTKKSIYDNCMK